MIEKIEYNKVSGNRTQIKTVTHLSVKTLEETKRKKKTKKFITLAASVSFEWVSDITTPGQSIKYILCVNATYCQIFVSPTYKKENYPIQLFPCLPGIGAARQTR
jgi:hypothetical protein